MPTFLVGIQFSRLTEDQIAMLKAPLTPDEIAVCKKSIEFYLHYGETFIPKLLSI